MAPSDKSQGTKSLCNSATLQDGINQNSKIPNSKGRLAHKTQPEGCLSISSSEPLLPEVPQIPLAGPVVAIHSPAIWTKQCTLYFHQNNETSYSDPEETGNSDGLVPGRYDSNGKLSGKGQGTLSVCSQSPNFPGVHTEQGQECNITESANRILRIQSGLQDHDDILTIPEIDLTSEISSATSGWDTNTTERDSSSLRYDGGSPPSDSTSTAILQTTGMDQNLLSQSWPFLRRYSSNIRGHTIRFEVVDSRGQLLQWATITNYSMEPDYRIRCFQTRLGCQLPRDKHRWTMDSFRTIRTHKLTRDEGSLPGLTIFLFEENIYFSSPPNGQYYSDFLLEQVRRQPLTTLIRPGQRSLDLVHPKENNHPRRTLAGVREYPGRLGESTPYRLQRLETRQEGLLELGQETGSIHNRSICLQDKCSVNRILQLETRSHSLCSGCTVNIMEQPSSVLVPTICTDPSLSDKNSGGEDFSGTDCSSVAQSDLVSSVAEQLGGHTDSSSTHPGHCDKPYWPESSTSSARSPTTSRMACFRRSNQSRGLSERVIDMLWKSWRPSTESSYSTAWRQWNNWCIERQTNSTTAPISEVLEFLYDQFESGKQYRTINSLRSAISMTHDDVDGTRIGQHPLVTRFLKGVYNSRPPAPRYSTTWNVDIMLSHLSALPDNLDLELKLLTYKVVMLLALTNADRCSDLAALDLNYRTYQSNGVHFVIPGLTKSRRSGPPKEAFYPMFIEEPKLCPVSALREYEGRTKEYRSGHSRNPLFLSVKKPFRAVKPATIGHWLKNFMKEAGIDTSTFTAHSTRGAATSKAKAAGVPMADILKAANWSSSSTFCRFYNRPTNDRFGQSILSRVSFKRYHAVS